MMASRSLLGGVALAILTTALLVLQYTAEPAEMLVSKTNTGLESQPPASDDK